ncbi:PqqD family protein [Halanaerobium praevalens]|uniref:Coenzyme PQQ synthesis D n=1 Tax=Halanaerobium praevalens (strain ATCC 33744 / DSM 2228 / GSL) TaxID=572479 RepID=E3DNH7_HALPG|nr:PqqD family protein [Halanaerobium praevalens]ADO76515.1 hypothetical protein Hprae_0359 [Halanaerobium praevalens DSM 2228]
MTKAKKKDKYNFVLYVPEITHQDWELQEGQVLLNFEVKHPLTKFAGFLMKKEPQRDMLLDQMSSAAWLLIDGQRSVFEIARIQSQKTDDEFKEDLRRLVNFIKFISKKGWIKYKTVKPEAEIAI